MIFAWDDLNREHVGKHQVSPEEAEQVVRNGTAPFPKTIEDDKLVTWGATEAGRYLQVIYVLKKPEEVQYESLTVEEWMEVESGGVTEVVRIVHAMDLTARMRRQLRRHRR